MTRVCALAAGGCGSCDVAKVQHKLENARVKLSKVTTTPEVTRGQVRAATALTALLSGTLESGQWLTDLHCCAVAGGRGRCASGTGVSRARAPSRTPFQRDRERIVQARAFRRLAGKTQVFTSRASDHFRSRLTHTIEVAQIARAVAAALGLNEDLAETLALVHDIGHPPFGHAGERALDRVPASPWPRFDHNLHALRIVEHFEQRYAAHRGLNLTLGVREGIIKHSRDYSGREASGACDYFLDQRPPLGGADDRPGGRDRLPDGGSG